MPSRLAALTHAFGRFRDEPPPIRLPAGVRRA